MDRRRVIAEIVIDGQAVSGVVTDETGGPVPFSGWLQLIALLQPADVRDEGAPERTS